MCTPRHLFATAVSVLVFSCQSALAHSPSVSPIGMEHPALPGEGSPAERVVDAFHAALRAGDTTKAASLMADDLLVFEAGNAERSKAAYAQEHLAADAKFESTVVETVLRRSGATRGDTAWFATEGWIKGASGDKTIDRLTTETMVLARTNAGWRIVHVHWPSRAAPSPKAVR